jgi:Kelch motif
MAVVVGAWARYIAYTSNIWSTMAPLPAAQSGSILGGYGTAATATTIYVVNGAYSTTPNTRTYAYTQATNTWATLTQTTISRRYGMWGAAYGAYLYFGGGRPFSGPSYVDAYRYDPGTNTYASVAPGPSNVGTYRTAGVIGSTIYLSGSVNDTPAFSSSPFIAYNAGTNTWSTLSSLFAPGSPGQVIGVVSGKLVVAYANVTNLPIREFDPSTNTWAALAFTGGTYYINAYLQGGQDTAGTLVVAGGSTGNTTQLQPSGASAATYRYTRSTNVWTTGLTAMPAAVAQGGSAMSADGRYLYVIGGTNGTTFQSSVYLYNT